MERDFTYFDIVTGCVGVVDRVPASTKGDAECHGFFVGIKEASWSGASLTSTTSWFYVGNNVPVTVCYLVDRFVAALVGARHHLHRRHRGGCVGAVVRVLER